MSAGQGSTLFAVRRIVQSRDYRITVLLDEYVKTKLHLIEVPKGYLLNAKEISEEMITNVQGVNGGLGLLSATGRPDMAAPTRSSSHLVAKRKSPQLISEVDVTVRKSHTVPITLTILPLPFAELRWRTFTDPGFDTGERQRHQQGWLVCATNKYFSQERTAPVSASLTEP